MKVTKHLKNRRLMAVLVGVVVFGGIYGLAASFTLTTDQLGSGATTVSSCTGPNEVEVSYDTAWNNPSQGATGTVLPGGYYVYDVVLDGVPLSCAGNYFSITLTGGDASTGGIALETETGQLPNPATDPSVIWNTTYSGTLPATYNCSDSTGNLNPPGPSASEPQYTDASGAYPPTGTAGPEPSCDWTVPLSTNVLAAKVTNVEMVLSTTQSDGQNTAMLSVTPQPFSLTSDCPNNLLIQGSGFGTNVGGTYQIMYSGKTILSDRIDSMRNGSFEAPLNVCGNTAYNFTSGLYSVVFDAGGVWAKASFSLDS